MDGTGVGRDETGRELARQRGTLVGAASGQVPVACHQRGDGPAENAPDLVLKVAGEARRLHGLVQHLGRLAQKAVPRHGYRPGSPSAFPTARAREMPRRAWATVSGSRSRTISAVTRLASASTW